MNRFKVTYIHPYVGEREVFPCMAESKTHAKEQFRNAYPSSTVVIVDIERVVPIEPPPEWFAKHGIDMNDEGDA